jgi:hypothetical protein
LHQTITIPGFRMKDPITLYWWDGLEVVKFLFANPVFLTCIEVNPYKLLDKEMGLHVYGDFMSAEFAWEYQVGKLNWSHVRFSWLSRGLSLKATPCLAS